MKFTALKTNTKTKKKPPNNYAIFDPCFIWDKDTVDEKTYPTLEMLYVQPECREEGIGRLLVQAVLEHMQNNHIDYCVFDNYAKYFWAIIAKETNGLVVFPLHLKNRIGILRINNTINVDNVM